MPSAVEAPSRLHLAIPVADWLMDHPLLLLGVLVASICVIADRSV